MKKYIIVFLLFAILLIINQNKNSIENFDPYFVYNPFFDPSHNCFENASGKVNCIQYPIYNPFLVYPRSTKMMSYDIRGEPMIIPKEYLWNNPERFHI